MYTRRELHQVVLDVELVLISVVQGVALTTLAMEAAPVLRSHDVAGWAFVGTGLLFVLSFWSVALVHALSFLTWPVDLVHYFFYFGVALLECLTFTRMEHPREWFGYSLACFVVSWALYAYDARLIDRRKPDFDKSPETRALYQHIQKSQRFEMRVLVPSGLIFCAVAYVLVTLQPSSVTPLAVGQCLLSALYLASFVKNFTERQRLISACITG